MAIINVTTDSFTGDGLAQRRGEVRAKAEKAIADGAHILDIGGESSRPGSSPVSVEEELERVVPVVEDLSTLGIPVSVDTTKPEVMVAALKAGASIINDIRALEEDGALAAVQGTKAGVCLMHMKGLPLTMQASAVYGDVVTEVARYLDSRVAALGALGVSRERIAVDPGFGFGKTLDHNIALFKALAFLKHELQCPLLVGVSRKTMLGDITGRSINERAVASVAAAMLAVRNGASIVRVHDVAATRDALCILQALGD